MRIPFLFGSAVTLLALAACSSSSTPSGGTGAGGSDTGGFTGTGGSFNPVAGPGGAGVGTPAGPGGPGVGGNAQGGPGAGGNAQGGPGAGGMMTFGAGGAGGSVDTTGGGGNPQGGPGMGGGSGTCKPSAMASNCVKCADMNCCDAVTACGADPNCVMCETSMTPPASCGSNAAVMALSACGSSNCKAECLGGGTGGAGGSGMMSKCGGNLSDPTCDACAQQSCCAQLMAVANNPDAQKVNMCQSMCAAGDMACASMCDTMYPKGKTDNDAFQACLGGTCASKCGGGAPSACSMCLGTSCAPQQMTAQNDADTKALLTCIKACAMGDTACQNTCAMMHQMGTKDYNALVMCAQANCATPCMTGGGMGMGGAAGTSGAGGAGGAGGG